MPHVFNQEAVKRLREGLGLSVPEFAKRIGISTQSAYDLESGNPGKKPNVKTLEKIMRAFNAEPMIFFAQDITRKQETAH